MLRKCRVWQLLKVKVCKATDLLIWQLHTSSSWKPYFTTLKCQIQPRSQNAYHALCGKIINKITFVNVHEPQDLCIHGLRQTLDFHPLYSAQNPHEKLGRVVISIWCFSSYYSIIVLSTFIEQSVRIQVFKLLNHHFGR